MAPAQTKPTIADAYYMLDHIKYICVLPRKRPLHYMYELATQSFMATPVQKNWGTCASNITIPYTAYTTIPYHHSTKKPATYNKRNKIERFIYELVPTTSMYTNIHELPGPTVDKALYLIY